MMQAVKGQNTKFSIFTGDVVEGSSICFACRTVLLKTTQLLYGLSMKSAANPFGLRLPNWSLGK